MKRIILKPGEEGRIRGGHPWVYDNEIARVLDGKAAKAGSGKGAAFPASQKAAPEVLLEPGELADVESSRKEYLGRAFVNPASKIRARIYSPSKEGMDKGFFKRRIREAIGRRVFNSKTVNPTAGMDLRVESARLVFAEADFLPALVIDRFVGWPLEALETSGIPMSPLSFEAARAALGECGSWLAVQFLAYGVDARREEILDAVEEVLGSPLDTSLGVLGTPLGVLGTPLGVPLGIVEKSGAAVRELEGLPLREGLLRGSFPPGGIVIFENGLPFAVNLEEGQKTGHFLDQKENRRRAAAYAVGVDGRGGRVLDAFTYSGGFAVHAARFGAAEVIAVDVSKAALNLVRRNAALNGVEEKVAALEADVFDYLGSGERKREQFDLIILDPPAFAKSKSALEKAVRGYKEINLKAIKLLKSGGVLVTCSCSQAMDDSRFKHMVAAAAADADRRLVQLDFRYQAADHPILLGYDESCYLKCGCYRVV
ncbi:MAG: class I SAM-dependent rRNA methyltransferase [Treponema sp.]|nr:class I SAM-dependent rRNA methyltransferase [Treponema sp.]